MRPCDCDKKRYENCDCPPTQQEGKETLREIADRQAKPEDVCPECGGCISEGTHILGCKQQEGRERYYYKYSQREHCVFDRRAGVDWDCIKAKCNDSESGKKFAELIVSALNQFPKGITISCDDLKMCIRAVGTMSFHAIEYDELLDRLKATLQHSKGITPEKGNEKRIRDSFCSSSERVGCSIE